MAEGDEEELGTWTRRGFLAAGLLGPLAAAWGGLAEDHRLRRWREAAGRAIRRVAGDRPVPDAVIDAFLAERTRLRPLREGEWEEARFLSEFLLSTDLFSGASGPLSYRGLFTPALAPGENPLAPPPSSEDPP